MASGLIAQIAYLLEREISTRKIALSRVILKAPAILEKKYKYQKKL